VSSCVKASNGLLCVKSIGAGNGQDVNLVCGKQFFKGLVVRVIPSQTEFRCRLQVAGGNELGSLKIANHFNMALAYTPAAH
jgi:hypothetical protein